MRSPPRWSGRTAGALVAVAAGGLLSLPSCGDNTSARLEPATSKLLGVVNRPTAAALDSEGKTVFVTGYDADNTAQLYSLPATGGAATKVATSIPLGHPLALAIDGNNNLYIADTGLDDGDAIFRGTTAGLLMPLAANGPRALSGLVLSPDGADVYVTGRDRTDGQPGVFKIPAAGGDATVVAKGAPFTDPAGLTFANDGVLYVIDATAAGTGGAVIKVEGSTATLLTKTPLRVGYAAGISPHGKSDLMITSNDPGAAGIFTVSPTGELTAKVLTGDKLNANGDPATITQASKSNAWVVVDTATPPQGSPEVINGAILLLTP